MQVTLLPAEAAVPPDNRASFPLAAVFAALTFVTTLGASGVPILAAVATGDISGLTSEAVVRALPGTVATFALLGAHPHTRGLRTTLCLQTCNLTAATHSLARHVQA